MKKTAKIIALALTLMMLAGMTALTASAQGNDTISVSLLIEGIEEPLYYNKSIELTAGETVADLMAAVDKTENSPGITITDAEYGSYVSEVGGLAEFAYGAMSGWSYRVNGLSPTFGMDMYKLEDGDSVVYYYGDPFGIGMQYPEPDLTRLLDDGVIRFTSIDATYDEDWNEILTRNPVEGASVSFDGHAFITDENGDITVADKTGLSGFHTLQIERYDAESGVPTVLRLAPDYMIYIPYADTPDGAWYDDAVMYCVREGYFVGTDAAKNLFAPLDKMNMAQLITVLARIGGVDPALTTGAQWYKAPLEWALANGLLSMTEDELSAMAPDGGVDALYGVFANMTVTRQQFIYLFYETAALAGTYDMTARADITGAADYADIGADTREAISWAVASGIIQGTGVNTLTIDPTLEMNRAMACQMLLNYYN